MKKSNYSSTKSTDSQAITKEIRAKSNAPSGLREMFEDELKELLWAEKELTKTIRKMIANVSDEELEESLTNHLEETKKQIIRLDDVFATLGQKAVAKKCDAMADLIKESEDSMEESEAGAVRDTAVIVAAQKIESYEIDTYGTLASFAHVLGEKEAANLLEITLSEEKNANQMLSQISDNINVEIFDFEVTFDY